MELNVNLLQVKRGHSKYSIIFGILCILLASSWIIFRIIESEAIRKFDWISFGGWTLIGVSHLIQGLMSRSSFVGLFGKAYILINSEIISLKPNIFKKEQSISWSEIKSIDYEIMKFEFKRNDNEKMVMNLSEVDYILITQIKDTINHYAKEKNIQYSC